MSSTDPMYQKGYRAGRRRTEAEVEETKRLNAYAEQWNQVFITLLPTAMAAQGWTLDGKAINTGEERVRLCAAWADQAVRKLK